MEAKDAGDVKGSGGTLEAKGEPVAAPPDPKAPAPPPPRLASVLGEALERMDARANGTEKPIATPWASFNDTMPGGIWPGLHVLVAGTGVGKSTWALQLGLHAAKRGSPVAYVGLELDSAQIALRLVGEHARVGWSKLYTGTASVCRSATVTVSAAYSISPLSFPRPTIASGFRMNRSATTAPSSSAPSFAFSRFSPAS